MNEETFRQENPKHGFLQVISNIAMNPKVRSAAQIIWVATIVLFIVIYLWSNWSQFTALKWTFDFRFLIFGLIWAIIRRLTGGIRWVLITCYDSAHFSTKQVLSQLRIYFISGLAAYIPGSLWYMISRVQLGKNSGVSTMRTSVGVVYEIALLVWSGLFVGSYAAIIKLPQYSTYIIIIAIVLGIGYFLLMSPKVANSALRIVLKILKRPQVNFNISFRWSFLQFVVMIALWVTGGLVQFYMLKALQPGLPISTVVYISSSTALAWTIGFLAPWAPAGLGVREGILIWFLEVVVAGPIAIASAVVVRLATVFEDLFWSGISILFIKKDQEG